MRGAGQTSGAVPGRTGSGRGSGSGSLSRWDLGPCPAWLIPGEPRADAEPPGLPLRPAPGPRRQGSVEAEESPALEGSEARLLLVPRQGFPGSRELWKPESLPYRGGEPERFGGLWSG